MTRTIAQVMEGLRANRAGEDVQRDMSPKPRPRRYSVGDVLADLRSTRELNKKGN